MGDHRGGHPPIDELLAPWHEHGPDEEHGAFHTTLSREWEPMAPREKIPAMVSRQVFAFASGFLLTGAPEHLAQARRGVDYLLDHAWDEQYGGWYDRLSRDGEPTERTKRVPLQLYTNVGLTQYYLVTGDERAREKVRRSIEIRRTHGHDEEYGGYYQKLERDLSVADHGKNKHAHYGYVGSETLNLYLATRDPEILDWSRELCDLSIDRQMDEDGWIYGFGSEFDRQWQLTPERIDGERVRSVGAQLTAALAFLRLYHQSGESRYLAQGKRIADNVVRHGWDDRGFFRDRLVGPSHRPAGDARVLRWIQIYGSFLQLQLYNLTEAEEYLRRFRTAEEFYADAMVDDRYGGVLPAVDAHGDPVADTRKAAPWKTAYHEIEHALLVRLYLDLYVDGAQTTVHFRLDGSEGEDTHYVSPVDDPRVGIADVTIDGDPWPHFDAAERSVTLPPRADLDVAVTLSPVGRSAVSGRDNA